MESQIMTGSTRLMRQVAAMPAMKNQLIGVFLVCASLVQATAAVSQSVDPAVVNSDAGVEGFVADGWSLERQIDNDFNSDGLDDLLLIVRQNHKQKDQLQAEADSKSFDTMRRQILIAFKNKENDQYRLVHRNNVFIPARGTANVEDFLPNHMPLEPKPKGFLINLEWFMSAGGWEMELRSFQFEYRDGHFALVAFDSQRTNRGSGKTTGIKVNYLTGLAVKSSGNIQEDEVKEVTQRITIARLLNLADIGPAFDFDPVAVNE